MKRTICTFLLVMSSVPDAEAQTNSKELSTYWEMGISFGEIPIMAGSFKPGISVGYHVNRYLYLGGIYQITDHISRNDDSFDAKNLGFNNLQSSRERVAPRAILHARLRPHQNLPFVSLGILSNGTDKETVTFGDAEHHIGQNSYQGPITVSIKRKRAIRPALGIGYHHQFKNGWSLSTEWSFDWFNPVPAPQLTYTSDIDIQQRDLELKTVEIEREFRDNVHNRYHIFHLGMGYRF
ncbi:MAG: hypothetical protein AAFW89_03495 [Bacteroidota bacterium]